MRSAITNKYLCIIISAQYLKLAPAPATDGKSFSSSGRTLPFHGKNAGSIPAGDIAPLVSRIVKNDVRNTQQRVNRLNRFLFVSFFYFSNILCFSQKLYTFFDSSLVFIILYFQCFFFRLQQGSVFSLFPEFISEYKDIQWLCDSFIKLSTGGVFGLIQKRLRYNREFGRMFNVYLLNVRKDIASMCVMTQGTFGNDN